MTSERDSLEHQAVELAESFMALRRRAWCRRMPEHDISLPQLHILTVLQEQSPMTVSQLAAVLHISPPSASTILDRMEEHDLIERSRSLDDRRVVHVAPSEHGQRVAEEMMGLGQNRVRSMFSAMSTDELRDVLCGMQALYGVLTRIEQTQEPPCDPGAGTSDKVAAAG